MHIYSRSRSRLHSHLLLVASVVALLLGGCASAPQKNRWTYACPDGFVFQVQYSRNANSVTVTSGGQSFDLKREESASGSRYAGDEVVFWSKGVMARLELPVQDAAPVVYANCQGDNDIPL
jgi:membrane-bound inhibitor of C-type lysozyme